MYQFPPSGVRSLSFIGSAAEKRFRDGAVLQMGEKVSQLPEKVIIMWSVRLDLMGNQ